MGCGILVPQPGIEPMLSAVEGQSLNHWTAREVLVVNFFACFLISHINLILPTATHDN